MIGQPATQTKDSDDVTAAEAEPASFLRAVLNSSPDCIKVLTLDGDLVFMNGPGRVIMEVDDFETIRGCAWTEFWDGEHKSAVTAALAQARAGTAASFVGAAATMKGTVKWWDVSVSPILDESGRTTHIVSTSRDVTEAKVVEAHRQLLADELLHRVKNVLAVVGAIAHQTFRGGDERRLDIFAARLTAMSEAQTMLVQSRGMSASVRDIVANALAPLAPATRVSLDGPEFQLDGKRAVALALAVHELCTNAIKYGAFANGTGTVSIGWSVVDDELVWSWREAGGLPVARSPEAGFGSRIIKRNLASEFGGTVDMQMPADGIVLTLVAPVNAA